MSRPAPSERGLHLERLTIVLPAEPPSEFRIFAAGDNKTTKGSYKFTPRSAELVMKTATEWGNEYSLDYEHAAVSPVPVPAPAAGWYALELREGELWAKDVRWTPRAVEMLTSREYRYVSPAFRVEGRNEVVQLINVALTNLPATKRQRPLIANWRGTEMDVFAVLGLAETASDTDAQLLILALRNFERELLSLTNSASREEAHGVLTAWRESHEQAAQLRTQVTDLQAELQQRERTRLIETAVREGKLTPALKTWAEQAPTDTLTAYLAAAPVVVPQGSHVPPVVDGVTLEQALAQVQADLAKEGRTASKIEAVLLARQRYPHLRG